MCDAVHSYALHEAVVWLPATALLRGGLTAGTVSESTPALTYDPPHVAGSEPALTSPIQNRVSRLSKRVYPQAVLASVDPARTDEELMRDLARGQQQALGPLYSRYASLVFHLSAQSLDRAIAEELVQEVFLTVWRGAASFDPQQGAFRPWLLRLTHWKILNELRRRRRQPTQDGEFDLVDEEPGPEERAWQSEHERILKTALDALPPKQRQAVAMAFLQDMTHEQVARALDVPLGTAKTRIRSGLQILRLQLAPIAASLLGLGLAIVGFQYLQTRVTLDREERAIALVTTSELVPLRLVPTSSSVPVGAHANYRGREGNAVAVLSVEALPAGTYQAWVRHADRRTSMGTFSVDKDGNARLIAENTELSTPPDAVEITLEPAGTPVLAWSLP
jgi:RNA polymerase sigma-70 factor (ECF subfamily)